MVRKIEVVPYDSEWPFKFENEAKHIRHILGEELIEIHHVGSTAIPGISAKPVIDMMPVVRDIEDLDTFNPQFIELGYEPRGEFGLPGRRYFSKGDENIRTHHMHAYQEGNPEIERHLAFRNYMIAHPDEAMAYSKLKESLTEKFMYDIDGYCEGKDSFIKERERRALKWIRSQ